MDENGGRQTNAIRTEIGRSAAMQLRTSSVRNVNGVDDRSYWYRRRIRRSLEQRGQERAEYGRSPYQTACRNDPDAHFGRLWSRIT